MVLVKHFSDVTFYLFYFQVHRNFESPISANDSISFSLPIYCMYACEE